MTAATMLYTLLLALALVVRPIFGAAATGTGLALASTAVFPLLGLVIPLAGRLSVARRQLRAWTARGEPPDEAPVDGSLPGALDLVVGGLAGGVLSVLIVLGLVLA